MAKRLRIRPTRAAPMAPGLVPPATPAEQLAWLLAFGLPRPVIAAILGEDALRLEAQPEVPALAKTILDSRRARPDDLVAWLTELARADARDLFDEAGRVRNPKTWPPTLAVLVQQYTETPKGATVRFVDRVRILELLGKHLGIFRDTLEKASLLARIVNIPPERLSLIPDEDIDRAVEAIRFLEALAERCGVPLKTEKAPAVAVSTTVRQVQAALAPASEAEAEEDHDAP
jgi:hypothetical protein